MDVNNETYHNRNDASKYYFISNDTVDGDETVSVDDNESLKIPHGEVEDIEAFLNDKYYNIVIGNMKSQILQEIKDSLNSKEAANNRLSENLEKEVNFLRSDSTSKNKIIELIIKNGPNCRNSSNTFGSNNCIDSDIVNIEESYSQTTNQSLRNNSIPVCERMGVLSNNAIEIPTDANGSNEDLVDIPNNSILNEVEIRRMRKALGDSAKRFMESMSTVDDMKNYIVNMAVDIKMKECDVMIPGIVPLNNLLKDKRDKVGSFFGLFLLGEEGAMNPEFNKNRLLQETGTLNQSGRSNVILPCNTISPIGPKAASPKTTGPIDLNI